MSPSLLKIGDRIINRDHVVHCTFDKQASLPHLPGVCWRECVVTFGPDDIQVFLDDEADQVWAYLSVASTNITPHKQLNAAA